MTINKTIYGFGLGLVLPAVTALLFYKFAYRGLKTFEGFIDELIFLDSASMLLAVCALSNLAFFLVFAHLNKLNIARGLFIATILYGIGVLVLKFIVQ